MAKLQLNKVTKIYDKSVYATKDITFDVCDKEFSVLVGPSGCGKTTALRLIAGLEDITSGEIYIYGRRGKITLSACLPEGLLPRTGELFTLRIDPAKIYLFDAKNKQALQ